MKVAIVGSRGIPAAYGGFETFAEEISVRLQSHGIDMTVVCQKSVMNQENYKGVRLDYSKHSKATHPLKFYFDSIRRGVRDSDIVIVCGVGGAIFYPLLKSRKCILITHTDGREELRSKFSTLKKWYVRLAQAFTARFSDHIISDGMAVRDYWRNKYGLDDKKISAIEFGASIRETENDAILKKFDLIPQQYFLVVCRMVPENNLELILNGYIHSGSVKKLFLVGATDDNYGEKMRSYSSKQIQFAEGVYDKESLFALRKNCFAYIHGHSVGGTNPSLLEAMAAGNICICHDNEFNRETTANQMIYFRDEDEVSKAIKKTELMTTREASEFSVAGRKRINEYYNWDRITNEYLKLFNSLVKK